MRESAAFRKGIIFLQEHIRGAAEAGAESGRLPPLKECAQQASISYQTMWKAALRLRQQGVLRAAPGRGTYFAAKGSVLPGSTEPTRAGIARERVAARICADIDQGFFESGKPLASPKELATRYGVCLATLRRSLHALDASGWITRVRRTWVVSSGAFGRQGAKRVVLFCRGLEEGRLLDITARIHDHLRYLETECAVNGIELEVFSLYYRGSGLANLGTALQLIDSDLHYAGFIVWTAALPTAETGVLLDKLNRQRLPAAVLDESGMSELFLSRAWKSHLRWYRLGLGALEGRIAGRYLFERGHRRVAYFESDTMSESARNRRNGFLEPFEQGGCGASASVYRIEPALAAYIQSVKFERLDRAVEELLKGSSSMSLQSDQYGLSKRLNMQMQDEIRRALPVAGIRSVLFPMLEEILTAGRATALVGYNDAIALECLDFCRERGIDVPNQVSVLGFDDGRDAFLMKMSSYNFGGARTMHSIIRHISSANTIGPTSLPQESQGFINERQTTARVDNRSKCTMPFVAHPSAGRSRGFTV